LNLTNGNASIFELVNHQSLRTPDGIVVRSVESPLGPLLTGATSDAVCLLEFTDRRRLETQMDAMRRRFRCAVVHGDNTHLARLRSELDDYFAGRLHRFTVPLAAPGTPFQERVWAALLEIPYGQTLSYEELARKIGAPGSQRAVGTANGMNRIAIAIPCHRVINKNGKLGGYGGLLWRKEALLQLEQGLPFARGENPD
jgi:AraC family transcriptional regulator of adaptative response/methylated-DNA-[protein]-cysteine methyltransferase